MYRHIPLRLLFVFVLAFLTLYLVFFLVDSKLRPIVLEIASLELENQVTIHLDEVCASNESLQDLDYNELVTIQQDASGRITALRLDSMILNRIRNGLITDLDGQMNTQLRTKLHVPLGSVLAPSLFSGLGPDVSVEILQIGCAGVKFESTFSSAGINQTRHQILLTVTAEALLLLPGGTAKRQVSASTIVAETVLLGDVPERYAVLDSNLSAADSMAEE